MPTLFSSVNVALQAVLAHQQSIAIIEHNVANANTAGYRRQEAILGSSLSHAMPGFERDTQAGVVGNGVMVTSIKRFTMEFVDSRYRREAAETGKWDLHSTVIQQVESTLAETGSDGLLPKLDAFWDGWRAIAADPTNTAQRVALVDKAQDLSRGFQRRASELQSLQKDQNAAIEQRVVEINETARQVAALNTEIGRVLSVGNQPNDLMDERDRMLDRLSQLTGATAYVQDNGEVMVAIGDHALVVGHNTFGLHTQQNALNPLLLDIVWDDGNAFSTTTGEVNAILDIRNNVIPNYLTQLNTLATTLMNRINTVHTAGFGLDGVSTGNAFFTGTDALNINVNPTIVANTDLIAAAQVGNAAGDGNNAGDLARVKDELLLTGFPPTQTLNQYYTSTIANFGILVSRSVQSVKDHKLVSDALDQQRSSMSGVSLDEEAAKLVQSQRSYEAASRVLTAIDQMIDKIINGTGMVGR